MNSWKTLSSRIAYENPFMRVYEDQAINPQGEQTVYGYVESTSGSVYVVPIDEYEDTYLSENFGVDEERVGLKRLPLDTAIELIMAGEIECDPSITALFMANTYLNKENA